MSDYYWQSDTVTELQKVYITQIKYTIHDIDKNPDIFEIKEMNIHDKVPKASHRVYLPQHYRRYLEATFWRYYLLIKLFLLYKTRRGKSFTKFFPTLVKNLVHLDNVIEATIRPLINEDITKVPQHKSRNYEEYLITEFLIGRHDPKTVTQFRRQCPTNIERMSLTQFDWEKYAKRLPSNLEGRKYGYNIDNVPKNDFLKLWKEVETWYTQKLDPQWISSWVEWDGEGTHPKNVEDQDRERGKDDRNGEENLPDPSQDDATMTGQENPLDDHGSSAPSKEMATTHPCAGEPTMQVDDDSAQTMRDTTTEQTPAHGGHMSPPFPPNQLMLGGKRPKPWEDGNEERPAKRRSETPKTRHPTPSDDNTFRVFDLMMAALPSQRKIETSPHEQYVGGDDGDGMTPGGSTTAVHVSHSFPPPSPIGMSHGDEEMICDNAPLPSNPFDSPPEPYDTQPNVAPSSERALEDSRHMEEAEYRFSEWTGFGGDIQMNDTTREATDMPQDAPIKTKRSRGRPAGSKRKVKRKVTQEVINTRILRSQASSAAHGEVAKHDYDVVEVTVSPRKVVARPPPSKMREVSPTPVRLAAGPSRSIEAPSKPTQPSPSQDEVSMLTRLTETTKYLAKGCKNGDDGMDVQVTRFFSRLKDLHRTQPSEVLNVLSQLKTNRNTFNTVAHDVSSLGAYLRRLDGAHGQNVDINAKKGFVILAKACGLKDT